MKVCLIKNLSIYFSAKNKGIDGVDRPHQGVGPETADENDRRVHAYYQWVPFVLFLQVRRVLSRAANELSAKFSQSQRRPPS